MHRLIFSTVFFTALSVMSPLANAAVRANAGGVDSGGGKTVVCRDGAGKITSAELLDLWEGRSGIFSGGPRIPLPNDKEFREQLREVTDRMPTGYGVLHDAFKLFDGTTFLQRGQRLEPSNDALPVLSPPVGCQFEQAAAYNLRLQRLFFDSEIWSSLDDTNRAALILHETIYDRLRKWADEKNSFYTRQVISYLFANREISDPSDNLPSQFYLCSVEGSEGISISTFFLFQGTGSKIVLQPQTINRVPLFAKSVEELSFYPGAELSIDQLVGAADIIREEASYRWGMLIGANGPATMGWIQELRSAVEPNTKRIKLEVAYYRPGESRLNVPAFPVTCSNRGGE